MLALGVLSGTLLWGQEARTPQTPVTREEIHRAVTDELRQQGVREDELPRLDDIELPAALFAAAGRTLVNPRDHRNTIGRNGQLRGGFSIGRAPALQ